MLAGHCKIFNVTCGKKEATAAALDGFFLISHKFKMAHLEIVVNSLTLIVHFL